MSKKFGFQQIIYLVIAIVLVGVALSLWILHSEKQVRQADITTPLPAITVAPPPLPTMGYGPLSLTPLAAPIDSSKLSGSKVTVSTPVVKPNIATTNNTDLSDRFGIIVTGLDNVPDKAASLNRVLDLTGAKWWYQYAQIAPDQPDKARQVYIIRVDKDGVNGGNYQNFTNFIKSKSFQNSFWMVGNEPNVPGQDDTPPAVYAKTLHELATTIKAADPNATIVGPNVLNWNYTCKGCPGYTTGLTWFEQMQDAYQSQFQTGLPIDAYSMHTYSLDWDTLPLLNHTRDVEQIQALRTFLDANPDTRNKPIWLSEFGIIWGYDALSWGKDANGNTIAIPAGKLRTDLISNYFNDTLGWLKDNALRLNLARWFIYTSFGLPESYSNTFSGISLVDGTTPQANLTDYGKIYVRYLKGN